MAHEFTRDLQNLNPYSFSEMNPSNNHLRPLENFRSSSDNHDQEFMAFSNNNHQLQALHVLPINISDNIQTFMKASPPAISGTGPSENNQNVKSYEGRKRKRNKDEKDMEKPGEVIHVRAKRGQATDSHSLAERVRREKINGKLRCLQDLVPGCYKTMGMAVMLDVIINYVQSLQNQIEFLSTKLSAASMYYDFNLDRDDMENMQGTNANEVQEMERIEREGYEGGSYFQSAWPL